MTLSSGLTSPPIALPCSSYFLNNNNVRRGPVSQAEWASACLSASLIVGRPLSLTSHRKWYLKGRKIMLNQAMNCWEGRPGEPPFVAHQTFLFLAVIGSTLFVFHPVRIWRQALRRVCASAHVGGHQCSDSLMRRCRRAVADPLMPNSTADMSTQRDQTGKPSLALLLRHTARRHATAVTARLFVYRVQRLPSLRAGTDQAHDARL
ncbi:hypothetical protein E2C01_026932 [Portunus trituberculatus]|uniref:Uncharacterized protein n=1 Tax=Portunus trituberculatus TaxID=210409 RepID=A0A5B7EK05_PORTR|nr:hypothetical protein [Portunus trituberculatus]